MMHLQAVILAVTALVSQVYCQTPADTQPSTSGNFPVVYGTTKVTPGIMLDIALTNMLPSFSYVPASTSQTYIILLVDLSINAASVNQSALDPQMQLPLAPGINANRTTRLHYWQPGLMFSSNGTVINDTTPIAIYNPPRPPLGDIAHTYTFYLFEQEAGFMLPANNSILSAGMVNMGMNRMSFNVGNLAKEMGVGPLVAANYYRVQNTMASATATTSSSSTSTSSATASAFTGGVEKPSVGLAALAMTASAIMFALSMGS